MAKREPNSEFSKLDALRADPISAASVAELERALARGSHHVVARAAKIVSDARVRQLVDALVKAFERFMIEPTKSDKGCVAKTAIARALYELEAREEQVFLRGIHHVQSEGVWGGATDTAAELRGLCALGLVRINYRDVMWELAELLADSEPSARLMAARAIAYSENDTVGAPLLKAKALSGDANPDVIGECFAGLLRLAPRKSVDFVARFIESSDQDLRHHAILALGESRQPIAFDLLKARYLESISAPNKRPFLLAMAMTRLPQAIEFMIEVIREADPSVAVAALDAMKMYRHDPAVRERIAEVVQSRNEPGMRALFARAF